MAAATQGSSRPGHELLTLTAALRMAIRECLLNLRAKSVEIPQIE
jgi:hypothetical protein